MVAAKYLVLAQVSGVAGRVLFGLLSDRIFGGRRRIVLAIAGLGSIACALAARRRPRPGTGPGLLVPLAVGIGFFGVGWNGVQHTLMAELAGPRAAGTAVGLGLAISSLGVTVCPPIFGLVVERVGGYGVAWVALAAGMVARATLAHPGAREGNGDLLTDLCALALGRQARPTRASGVAAPPSLDGGRSRADTGAAGPGDGAPVEPRAGGRIGPFPVDRPVVLCQESPTI